MGTSMFITEIGLDLQNRIHKEKLQKYVQEPMTKSRSFISLHFFVVYQVRQFHCIQSIFKHPADLQYYNFLTVRTIY